MNSGCWYIWMQAHLESYREMISFQKYLVDSHRNAEYQMLQLSAQQQLPAIIFCFNFVTGPRAAWEPYHL